MITLFIVTNINMYRILENIQRTFRPTDQELNQIADAFKMLQIKRSGYFLEEGQVSTKMGFLERGSMRLFYDSTIKEVCNDFFFENSIVGSLASFLTGAPSIVNIAALEDCEILTIGKEDVFQLMKVCKPFSNLVNFVVQEQFVRAEKREAELLKFQPEERYLHLLEIHPKIFNRIPLYYIASYLNITPETLSRYRKKFSH